VFQTMLSQPLFDAPQATHHWSHTSLYNSLRHFTSITGQGCSEGVAGTFDMRAYGQPCIACSGSATVACYGPPTQDTQGLPSAISLQQSLPVGILQISVHDQKRVGIASKPDTTLYRCKMHDTGLTRQVADMVLYKQYHCHGPHHEQAHGEMK
jgi:hypothetical protein